MFSLLTKANPAGYCNSSSLSLFLPKGLKLIIMITIEPCHFTARNRKGTASNLFFAHFDYCLASSAFFVKIANLVAAIFRRTVMTFSIFNFHCYSVTLSVASSLNISFCENKVRLNSSNRFSTSFSFSSWLIRFGFAEKRFNVYGRYCCDLSS